MKNMKFSSIAGSSIKSSLIRILKDKFFRGILYVLLCMMFIYAGLYSAGCGLEASIIGTNTDELHNDASIKSVSYINESGKVFLENSNSYDSYQYTKILYGNGYWYSEGSGVLACPMTFGQCVYEVGFFELVMGVCFLSMVVLVKLLAVGGIDSSIYKIRYIFSVILFILMEICEFVSVLSLSRLFVNNIVYYWIVGFVMSFICVSRVAIMKYLVDSVEK